MDPLLVLGNTQLEGQSFSESNEAHSEVVSGIHKTLLHKVPLVFQ